MQRINPILFVLFFFMNTKWLCTYYYVRKLSYMTRYTVLWLMKNYYLLLVVKVFFFSSKKLEWFLFQVSIIFSFFVFYHSTMKIKCSIWPIPFPLKIHLIQQMPNRFIFNVNTIEDSIIFQPFASHWHPILDTNHTKNINLN